MRTKLIAVWDVLRGSLWFVPTLMMVMAMAASFGMLALDDALKHEQPGGFVLIYAGGAEGARAFLSAVAGSMITVAGVAFSITVVALTLASQQFGPRLLRNFMRDRGNQIVLGTFIATFIYCLLILRAVRGSDNGGFIPHFSVTLGLILAIASLGVLIYFIHHVTNSIRASCIVASVAEDLDGAIDRLFPSKVGSNQPTPAHHPSARIPDDFHTQARRVRAVGSGYLQAIDTDVLMSLSVEHDLILNLPYRPGHFVPVDAPLLEAWPPEHLQAGGMEDMLAAFVLGDERTLIQDIEFSINQLVEIAVRALSPGTNDPFTAMTSIDRLGAALSRLAGRNFPSCYRYDDKGRLRLITNPITLTGVVDAAFNQIRQYGKTSAAVTIRLLETIAMIAAHIQTQEARTALLRHAAMIHRAGRETLPEDLDQQSVDERYKKAVEKLSEAGPLTQT